MDINKIFKIVLAIAILLIAISVFYRYVIYLPERFIPKEEKSQEDIIKEAVLERFNKYSDMISLNLCKEAYEEFITKGSMQRKGYENFQEHCKNRGKNWNNIEIQNIVVSSETRTDIKYNYDMEFKIIDLSLYLSGKSSEAKTEIIHNSFIETWLFEDGKWKRDY